jgi:hypothetical protein
MSKIGRNASTGRFTPVRTAIQKPSAILSQQTEGRNMVKWFWFYFILWWLMIGTLVAAIYWSAV